MATGRGVFVRELGANLSGEAGPKGVKLLPGMGIYHLGRTFYLELAPNAFTQFDVPEWWFQTIVGHGYVKEL